MLRHTIHQFLPQDIRQLTIILIAIKPLSPGAVPCAQYRLVRMGVADTQKNIIGTLPRQAIDRGGTSMRSIHPASSSFAATENNERCTEVSGGRNVLNVLSLHG